MGGARGCVGHVGVERGRVVTGRHGTRGAGGGVVGIAGGTAQLVWVIHGETGGGGTVAGGRRTGGGGGSRSGDEGMSAGLTTGDGGVG